MRVAQVGTHKGNQLALPHTQRGASFAHVVVEACRQPVHHTLGPDRLNGRPDGVVPFGRIVQSDVLSQGPAEQKHVLEHDAHAGTQLFERDFPNVHPVHGDLAPLEFVEPGNEVHNGTLACAGGAHERHPLSWADVEVHVAKHPIGLPVLLVSVGEPHAFKPDLAAPRRRLGMGRRRQTLVLGQQFEHTVGVHDAHLQHVEAVGQLADGAVQHEDVEDELQDHTQGQRVAHDLARAQPKQQAHARCAEQFHHRKKHTERPNRPDVGVAVCGVDVSEGLGFRFLAVEGLDNVHARHVLLDELVDLGHPVAHIHKGALDVTLEHPRGGKQHWNREKHNQGQGGVDVQHGSHDHHQGQQVAHRVEDAVAEHVGHAVDVAHVASHQRSDWRLVEVLQRKAGHVSVELGAQVQTHALRHPIRQKRDPVLHQGLDQQHPHHREEHTQEALHVAGGDVDVHGLADQRRTDPHQARQDHHHDAGPGEAAPVRTDLA